MKGVVIGSREVGQGRPCFVIAEAGVNHDGNLAKAMKLVDAAANSGADAVKFQAYRTSELVTRRAEQAAYQRVKLGGHESQFAMLKRLELGKADFQKLSAHAAARKITFLSSAFDRESVDMLDELGAPAFKIPSGEITNFPLLKHVANKRKPIILSTGMSTLNEVRDAVGLLRRSHAKRIFLLHCVSAYPARPEEVNLRSMETLERTFKLPVGLSDHTLSASIPMAAVALGACILEKHITLDREMEGPDHQASLEPNEFEDLVTSIRETEKAFGDGVKRPSRREEEMKKVARRSIVSQVKIPEGDTIDESMLALKRPGTGIRPQLLPKIVGMRAKRAIGPDEVISMSMLESG